MNYKTIKISEENYKMLLRESASLQHKYGEKKTFDDAITSLYKKKHWSEFVGCISEESAQKWKQTIKEMREKDK